MCDIFFVVSSCDISQKRTQNIFIVTNTGQFTTVEADVLEGPLHIYI